MVLRSASPIHVCIYIRTFCYQTKISWPARNDMCGTAQSPLMPHACGVVFIFCCHRHRRTNHHSRENNLPYIANRFARRAHFAAQPSLDMCINVFELRGSHRRHITEEIHPRNVSTARQCSLESPSWSPDTHTHWWCVWRLLLRVRIKKKTRKMTTIYLYILSAN